MTIFVVNLTFADPAPNPSELQVYLEDAELVPHSETVEGYQQVYYLYNGEKVYVTEGNMNHTNPKSSGRYITWLASSDDINSQVFLYDVLTNTTLQLSGYSTNTYPDLDGNHVVWQQWINNEWQVMYYDGLQVYQISSGSGVGEPRISGNDIVYAQYVADDTTKPWHVLRYNVQSQQTEVILTTNNQAKARPHFNDNGDLVTNYDLDYLSN